jgi:hypothetical protein
VVRVASPISDGIVAIGRADDGIVTVAYSEIESTSFGRIRTVSFSDRAIDRMTEGPTIEPVSTIGDVVGIDIAIATESPNIHHMAYWLQSDFGNEIRYVTLRDGLFSEAQSIASVGRLGVLDIALDSEGLAVIAWQDDTAGNTSARRQLAMGGWGLAANIRRGNPGVVGRGAVALATGAASAMHLGFQWTSGLTDSAPSYSVGTGGFDWSNASTIDNRARAGRLSGVSTRVTTVGDEVVLVYLDWADGHGEIRIARRSSDVVDPVITQHLPDLMIANQPPRHPLVLETDARGWLQLIVGDSGSSGCTLRYQRQTKVGGGLRFLDDPIAHMPGVACEGVYVDAVLGPDRRPHIVFWDPTASEFRYATIDPEA